MFRKLMISVAALAIAAPATAASIEVNFGSTTAIPANNNFQTELSGLGLTRLATSGSSLILDGAATITFYFLGSESGASDTFTALGTGAPVSLTENTPFTPFGSTLIGTQTYASGGSLAELLNFTSSLGAAAAGTVGDQEFGIFLGPNTMSGDSLTTLYFGYDDQINNADDNHDDFLVMAVVSAVPEPATWAMMIGGFGIAGAALRRRRSEKPAFA